MELQIRTTRIRLVRGSVLDQDADAIVNAANTVMRGGGGIDGAIHMAAGPRLLLELQRVAPKGSKTAEVVVTSGHDLPHKYILHVAGPIWRGGNSGEQEQLRSTYSNALDKVRDLGLESVAFPSISTGAFGYPMGLAAPVVLDTLTQWLQENDSSGIREIVLAMFGSAEFKEYRRVFDDRSKT